MKFIPRLSQLPLLFLFIIFSSYAQAEVYSFEITGGQVVASSDFCATRPSCPIQTAELSGTFSADISKNQILFSDIRVTTIPQIGFQLPENPTIDSYGTVRDITFSFNGEVLQVSGSEDQRAYDGPLYEYQFTAESTDQAGFDPKGFYLARPDLRKCVWPLCGGIFVNAVNQRFTQCADGSRAKECYVASVDWKSLGFDPLSQETGLMPGSAYLLQGRIESQEYDGFGDLGVFVGKGAYRPASANVPQNLFVGLQNNGIMCVTTPCFSVDEYILNRYRSKTISGIDLTAAKATIEDMEAAYRLIANGDVLIATGKNRRIKESTGYGISFVANQFYLPIMPDSSLCDEGYKYRDGRCLTSHDCEAPLIELKSFGGVPIEDPVTGEPTANIWYSCVDRCEPPMEAVGPAMCEVYMP